MTAAPSSAGSSGPASRSRIDVADLFARLAGDDARRITVVTPNRRLAQELERAFDRHQIAKGRAAWDAADILPMTAFLGRLYEDALYSGLGADLPLLLSAEEEQALWERVVGESREGEGLLARVQAASACRDAWRTAHAFGFAGSIAGFAENEDTRAFLAWSRAIERECARNRWTDAARLPALVASHLAHPALGKPACLVLHAFDLLTPQQRDFVDALAAHGVEILQSMPVRAAGRATRLAFPAAKDEILAAARWARARLEAGDAGTRIAVVVPDLQAQRKAIRRLFAAVMAPSVPGAAPRALPFNVSLGEPLSGSPVVHAALLLLEAVSGARIEFSRMSLLMRSPFIAGGEEEQAARARLEAGLRRNAPAMLSLSRLLVAIESGSAGPATAPGFAGLLGRLVRHAREHLGGSASPAEWGRRIDAVLRLAGFPGRAPDSAEYQALKKFHAVIAALGAIERVVPRMRFRDAVNRLRRMAADTLFQPEANDEPVQVLGVLESAGLAFDHLWVMGLTDEAWPLHSRPNPFLPIELQRRAGVPEASASSSLALDRRITEGWLGAAPEVVFSHPLRDGERELSASPLIVREDVVAAEVTAQSAHGVAFPALARDAQFDAGRQGAIERVPEPQAPGWTESEPLTAGTGVFRDQAACPFRAFAAHRLGAGSLDAVVAGLDAADRGTLIHGVLARAWDRLRDQAGLKAAIASGSLGALLAESANGAIARVRRLRPDALEGRFAELEAERLVSAAREWLETVDANRPPFAVEAVEAKRTVGHGGVSVQARLDRMDRLEDGARLVIDYKTGKASVSGWLGERPDEPQLPIYALAQDGVAAVAFAQVRPGAMKLDGIGAQDGLAEGIGLVENRRSASARAYAGWDELVAGWEAELDALGSAFRQGTATVDPKRGGPTCTHCGLQALCRVNERAAWGPTAGPAGGAEADE